MVMPLALVSERMREPMEHYYIDLAAVKSADRSDVIKTFVERILTVTDHEPQEIELFGLTDLLRTYVDDEAVETLQQNEALDPAAAELVGTVPATSQNLDAAIRLVSDPLIRLVIVDERGEMIFARYDTAENQLSLATDAVDRLKSSLKPDELALLERLPPES